MGNDKKLCLATWFSGFFGLGALLHLVRSIVKFPLVVNNYDVPVSISMILALVLGALSLTLLYVSCKKPCCEKKEV